MLVHSKELISHNILATTLDIAIGDMIDKCARLVLPANYIDKQGEAIAYGRLLEQFCFPDGEADWNYHPATTQLRRHEKRANVKRWGDWKLNKPLSKDKIQKGRMAFSFSALGSDVERYCKAKGASLSNEERKALGRWVFILAFEHLAERIAMALENLPDTENLVVSGGVASNRFMKHL
jgi:N6-L-threonylcarbamoyladenine synthase